ncbi:MAG TPA: phage tail protein [Acidocella sp.]|nr:phage tail protein [Acidocella sp.]
MPITQLGSINTTALIVPDLYVQIVPPQVATLNGVPTDKLGVVGTASWGPVNTPVVIGTMAEYARTFGPVMNRTYDMGTAVACAVLQGAQNFNCVRVTDGTDVAADCVIGSTAITLNALYSGTLGNSLTATIATGGAASSYNVTIAIPGLNPEIFTNITGTGNAFWVNLAAAINTGQGPLRGPSKLVSAVAGAATTAPTLGVNLFTGGTDGVATITSAVLVGVDTLPRKGMYALRGQGCSLLVLADATDITQWSVQAAFCLAEGIYNIQALPPGTSIATAITDVQTSGSDTYAAKIMHGDWVYWYDQTNAVIRLVSPQGFVAGRLANLSPEQSSLNKPIYGIIGSQTFGTPGTNHANHYASADLGALFAAGIDVVTNPVPGGNYWGVRGGINSSLNAAINGDNYTRLTNYISATLDAGMGVYIGQLITSTTEQNADATISNFLLGMWQQGMLGAVNGPRPYSVICDATNNPFNRTSLGYMQADVNVTYAPINRYFLVNLQGGQTVSVTSQPNA